ncbi:MAG: hypothetical protein P8Q41_04970 [Saprospiraceae bacterium]|nr:hypothetical protein [Saprospiraceae bacterium]
MSRWLERVIIVVSISYLTFSLRLQIIDHDSISLFTILSALIAFSLEFYFGKRRKDTFFNATIGLSITLITFSSLSF